MIAPLVSVIVPAYQAEATLEQCLRAIRALRVPAGGFETIVVDDGSSDATSVVARRCGVQPIRRPNGGAGAARNTGLRAAQGTWVAFTDADCMPARNWLVALTAAVVSAGPSALGAAGSTVGLPNANAAARFVDLSGGLDAARHLAHPRWPFAPTANVLYRRDALLAVGGFDERFSTYEACDLHDRLRRLGEAPFAYVPHAVVMHRHRTTWAAYWRQQLHYGAGYAQFFHSRADELPWGARDELRAWFALAPLAVAATLPASSRDGRLVRRGTFLKHLAQRLGFVRTYWNAAERRRWLESHPLTGSH